MTEKVFDSNYADQYDLLYGDKDYEAECNLLEEIFRKFADHKVQTILDLGCGTGNHAIPLALRGYAVTGVDISAEMLSHAIQKTKQAAKVSSSGLKPPEFIHHDLCDLETGQTYDVVLMMFAVLGYQIENADLVKAIHTVRKHLRPGGLFIFDVWYGPAVLAIRPSDRVKVIPINKGELIRAASGSLDTFHQVAEVNYRLWRIQQNQVISETQERHQMRFFFHQELAILLELAGMRLESLTAFPTLDQNASEESWNVLGVSIAT